MNLMLEAGESSVMMLDLQKRLKMVLDEEVGGAREGRGGAKGTVT